MASCKSRISYFEFTREEIEKAIKNRGLLSMEMEFTLHCNFRCPYCYLPEHPIIENELSREEICDSILQAQELGAKKIIILGGEPMLYPHILDVLRFIRKQHLNVEMFTNGSNITADVAKLLLKNGVNVVLKMNTFNEDIQDVLAGEKGAYKIIREAFNNLRQAGYPSEETFLAVSTVICRQNSDEIVSLWKWLRDQNIIPYFEMITPQGRARQNEWLYVDPRNLYGIFSEIADIDRKQYNHIWDPQPPLIGNECLRHQFSCLVNAQGYVMPCVGVNIPVGNIRDQKLKDIIKDSEVIQNLRNYRSTMKGPCRECEKFNRCYGCRGAAYQLTGDYLASDPLCWKNADRQKEIVSLPVEVEKIIPQKLPMRVIDMLVRVAEKEADITVTIIRDMPFVSGDGLLDETAYIEMMAQSVAAVNSFEQKCSYSSSKGFLLGAKKFEILGEAKVGDILKISVYKYMQFDGFCVVKGTISRDNHILARGEIKVWHNTDEIIEEVTKASVRQPNG